MSTPERIAILASGDVASGGGGSTADRFARDALEGRVALEVGVVICNNPPEKVGVYDRFDKINQEFKLTGDRKIDVINIGPNTHPGRPLERGQTLDESDAICKLLEDRDIDFVAMLGFMRIITGSFVEEWGWQSSYADGHRQGIYHPKARIINNHPAILPMTADTHGHGAHQRAIDLYRAGKITASAMSWHLASREVDGGPIVHEEPVLITPTDDADSLGDKIQIVEKDLTSLVIARHLALRRQHTPVA